MVCPPISKALDRALTRQQTAYESYFESADSSFEASNELVHALPLSSLPGGQEHVTMTRRMVNTAAQFSLSYTNLKHGDHEQFKVDHMDSVDECFHSFRNYMRKIVCTPVFDVVTWVVAPEELAADKYSPCVLFETQCNGSIYETEDSLWNLATNDEIVQHESNNAMETAF